MLSTLKRLRSALSLKQVSATELSDHSSNDAAAALFTVVLGRPPEPSFDLTSRARLSWRRQLVELVTSAEFENSTLNALIAQTRLPHLALSDRPDRRLIEKACAIADDDAVAQDLSHPFESWRDFIGAVLSTQRLWSGVTDRMPALRTRLEEISDKIACARVTLAAPPLAGVVVEAGLSPQRHIVGVARVFGSAPRQLVVGARAADSGKILAQAAVDVSENGIGPFLLKAPVVAADDVVLFLAEGLGRPPIGPGYRLALRLSQVALAQQMAEIASRQRAGDRHAAARAVDVLLQRAPGSIEAVTVAVEDAMWRGDRSAALSALEVGATQIGPEDQAVAAVKLRLAAADGDEDSAAAALTMIVNPSPLQRRLKTMAGARAVSKAIQAPGPEPLLSVDTQNSNTAAEIFNEIFAPPRFIALWLASSSRASREAAFSFFLNKASPAAAPVILSHLSPADIAPEAPMLAVAAAKIALQEGRSTRALAWAAHALAGLSVNELRSTGLITLLSAIDHPKASRLAANAMDRGSSSNDASFDDEALRLDLERRLVVSDQSRSTVVFKQRIERFRQRLVSALLAAPSDPGLRRLLATTLSLNDQWEEARAVFAALQKQQLKDTSALLDHMAAEERLERPQAVLALTERFIADQPDDASEEAVILFHSRALRALDRPDVAATFLMSFIDQTSNPNILCEAARSFFFKGDFERAAATADRGLDCFPDHVECRRLAIAAALELGQAGAAHRHLDWMDRDIDPVSMLAIDVYLMRCAAHRLSERQDACVSALNTVFDMLGCQRVTAPNDVSFGIDALTPTGRLHDQVERLGPAPLRAGPLVSVVMTAFNAEKYIKTSVQSILQQSYTPMELIIVDDASSDRTPTILRELASHDRRIRLTLKTSNDGTYVSKNIGLLQARGDYVALQDADDWSHPDRSGKTIATLEARPDLVAAHTDWVRMTTDGRLIVRSSGDIAQISRISLVFRRELVLRRAGFFDSVRMEADVEFMKRLEQVFGRAAVARLRWPLLIGRAHQASLTADATDGVTRTGLAPSRQAYQEAARAWRENCSEDGNPCFLGFPLSERPFPIPASFKP